MRRVKERSLSSILRSKLLTTLINNNDVSGKVNARGLRESFDKFDAIQMCFASGSAEKEALFEELDDEKILLPVVGGTLPCHSTAKWHGRER